MPSTMLDVNDTRVIRVDALEPHLSVAVSAQTDDPTGLVLDIEGLTALRYVGHGDRNAVSFECDGIAAVRVLGEALLEAANHAERDGILSR